jgi:hypothetical protein
MPAPPDARTGRAAPMRARARARAAALRRELPALIFAVEDEAVGWAPRLLVSAGIAIVLSPLDVLGPLGVVVEAPPLLWLATKVLPAEALARGRARADAEEIQLAAHWGLATVFFLLFNVAAVALAWRAGGALGCGPLARLSLVGAALAACSLGEVLFSTRRLREERHAALALAEPLFACPPDCRGADSAYD